MILAALLLAIAFVLASMVFAVMRGLELWRAVRAFPKAVGERIAELERGLEKLSAYEPPDLDRASEAFARLQRSRAQLTILLGALGRAREQFSAFAAVYPRK